MTFLNMVSDLKKSFGNTKLARSTALANVAGAVKGLVDAVGSETDEVSGVAKKARVRVYMPAKRKAKGSEGPEKVEPRVGKGPKRFAGTSAEEQKAAKAALAKQKEEELKSRARAWIGKNRFAEFAGLSKEDKKLVEKGVAEQIREEQIKRRKALGKRYREEFKTEEEVRKEEYKVYLSELKKKVKEERKQREGLVEHGGLAARLFLGKKTKLEKEYEKAQISGAVVRPKKDGESSVVKQLLEHVKSGADGLKSFGDEMHKVLLGPLAPFFKWVTKFPKLLLGTWAERKKEDAKKWFASNFTSKGLLAQLGKLREDGKETPKTLKLMLMVNTATQFLMGLLVSFGLKISAGLLAIYAIQKGVPKMAETYAAAVGKEGVKSFLKVGATGGAGGLMSEETEKKLDKAGEESRARAEAEQLAYAKRRVGGKRTGLDKILTATGFDWFEKMSEKVDTALEKGYKQFDARQLQEGAEKLSVGAGKLSKVMDSISAGSQQTPVVTTVLPGGGQNERSSADIYFDMKSAEEDLLGK